MFSKNIILNTVNQYFIYL